MPSKTKKRKLGRRIVIILVILVGYNFFFTGSINMHQTVTIARGDTFGKFTKNLGRWTSTKFKVYTKLHGAVNALKEGSYAMSGNYSFGDFVTQIEKGPTQDYIRYTVLEGWNIYDIDADLVKKGYIQTGEFLKYVSDAGTIAQLEQNFSFLSNFGNIPNLEGLLYPDTYFVDTGKPFAQQLVKQQLRAFESKVWNAVGQDMMNFNTKLNLNGVNVTNFSMSPYKILILASIVEKEVRKIADKPTVAGIFLKRLQIGMMLGSDITLCYGMKLLSQDCTPAVIGQHVNDASNPFNTRVHNGLLPQPINNPSIETINTVLNFQASSYLYYLYDNNGTIHYGTTLQEHNANKNQYLK